MKAMSKEEKIKEAWINIVGEKNYNFIKQFLSENGFTNRGKYHWLINNFSKEYIKDNFYVTIEIDNDKLFRPKSLQGIENNRGWIKIESESDLPTCDGEYFVNAKGINNNKQFFIRSWLNAKKDFNDNWVFTEYPKEWLELYSHYQPITKPKPPIY
jgi:hypothetical protein